ncbi:MAG TPA: hypothetical protein VK698_34430 [Kofleriaceae bacterium]|nr:hypothetical protein [Kofleriaceae bacterium]
MTRWLLTLPLAGLCACPAVSRTPVTVRAVATGGLSVPDAMVGAACLPAGRTAGLTDATGTARLAVQTGEPVDSCTVVVAKEGFATREEQVQCRPSSCDAPPVQLEPAR